VNIALLAEADGADLAVADGLNQRRTRARQRVVERSAEIEATTSAKMLGRKSGEASA
jgi:hypothetical protein